MSGAEKILPKEEFGNLVVVPFGINISDKEILLCINVQKVLEVIEAGELSPLPRSNHPFIGLYDHRLGPVPVLDIGAIVNEDVIVESQTTKADRAESKRLILCQLHRLVVGIIVDSTKRIEAIHNRDVLPVPVVLDKESSHLFNGLIRSKNGLMHMLDIENILHDLGVLTDSSTPSPPKSADSDWLAGKNILIVEDSELFRKKLEKILASQGAICHFAKDGQEGYEAISNRHIDYDLIFTDIEMPKMNGIEMIRKIKNIPDFSIPVIFNSSISNQSLIDEIEKEQLGEYIVKFSNESILKKISEKFAS